MINRWALGSLLCACLLLSWVGCGASRVPVGPSAQEREWAEQKDRERAGEWEVAAAGYEALCRAEPSYERACYDRVRLLFERGDSEAARDLGREFVVAFPDSGLAQAAMKHLVRSYLDAGAPKDGVTALAALVEQVRDTDVYDTAIASVAKLNRELGREDEERRWLERLVEEHDRWSSQLWDDAMWRLIEIHEERGERRRERERLEEFLREREDSWVIGSYDSPYFDDAIMRLAELLRAGGDMESALDALGELAKDDTSRLRDDALLLVAQMLWETGETRRACRALERLLAIEDASEEDEARALASRIGCADIEAK